MRKPREYSICLPFADIEGIHRGKRVVRVFDTEQSIHFEIGDFMYVKEPYRYIGDEIVYCFDSGIGFGERHERAVTLPKEHVRLKLRITDIRREYLQDIVEYSGWEEEGFSDLSSYRDWWNGKVQYKRLKSKGWLANPCVYVLSFERV